MTTKKNPRAVGRRSLAVAAIASCLLHPLAALAASAPTEAAATPYSKGIVVLQTRLDYDDRIGLKERLESWKRDGRIVGLGWSLRPSPMPGDTNPESMVAVAVDLDRPDAAKALADLREIATKLSRSSSGVTYVPFEGGLVDAQVAADIVLKRTRREIDAAADDIVARNASAASRPPGSDTWFVVLRRRGNGVPSVLPKAIDGEAACAKAVERMRAKLDTIEEANLQVDCLPVDER